MIRTFFHVIGLLLIAVLLAVVSTSVDATTIIDSKPVWTNQAQHPSRVRQRDYAVTMGLLKKMDVPHCARMRITSGIMSGKGGLRGLMTNNGIFMANGDEYAPNFLMSFRKAGHDYVQKVKPYFPGSDIAEVYSYSCMGKTVHVAYHHKCGNISRLIKKGRKPKHHYPEPDPPTIEKPHGTVSGPGTLLLISLGILIFLFSPWSKLNG